jgi:hypothetical protein
VGSEGVQEDDEEMEVSVRELILRFPFSYATCLCIGNRH